MPQPRHHRWPTHALLWLMRAVTRLPYRWQMALGSALGRALMPLLRRRAHIARTNLQLAFPEHPPQQTQALLKAHFRSVGQSLIELGLAWWRLPSAQAAPCPVQIDGLEHLLAAHAQGRGVLLFSAHLTAWEIGGSLLGEHLKTHHPDCAMSVSYRPHENPVLDQTMRQARQAHFQRLLPRDAARDYLKALKDGHILWYAADQNFGHKGSVFAPFFGIPAATNTATTRLAKISNAPVVPFFPQRLPDGNGYRLHILPALENFPTTPEQDAERLNRLIEDAVRQHPADYFWLHRRYKDRPNNAARYY